MRRKRTNNVLYSKNLNIEQGYTLVNVNIAWFNLLARLKLLFTLLRSVGILLVGFAVIALVNFPHDRLLNAIAAGLATNHVPSGTRAAWLSAGFVFLAGVLASTVVGLLDKRPQKFLLLVLMVLFY
jgi:hypothetical protein